MSHYIRIRSLVLATVSLFIALFASSHAQEKISVNFYAYGGLQGADREKVIMGAAESAGVGGFNTTGWNNYQVPWAPSSPQAPVIINSTGTGTATLVLNDVRNGGPYRNAVHTFGVDGDGDMMSGHCNATEDPDGISNIFDMEVTNIPYNLYTLVVYIGSNQAQFGDGKGKIILNGGPEQDFTLPSGEFAGFNEITSGDTNGNYIVYTKLRSNSFRLKAWGKGFNHIGPTGFQIIEDTSGIIPPSPASNPTPTNGVIGLPANTDLSWTAGLDAVSRNVYFGTNPTPGISELQGNQTGTTFDPSVLANGTYYWRIDEVNADGVTTGPVWSFSVGSPAKAFRPMPWDGMAAVATNAELLSWVNGESATPSTSNVYFGTDSTPDSSELQGNQSGTTFNLPALNPGTTYYWRIDQVNAQGTTTGDVWSFTTPIDNNSKVKVFILVGQSNTEGHGEMNPIGTKGTLEYTYANETATYAHLKTGGSWTVRDDAWIWYRRGGGTPLSGGLTAGYGANAATIGPELQFGHTMGDYYGEKVLIIKTAWGGKSLAKDFRPPSAGWSLDTPITAGDEGFYYKEMLDFVVQAMADIDNIIPTYNTSEGYEIAGFGWHQGWNDRVTSAFAAEYEANMEKFIKDVRLSLGAPNLPFVVATTGMAANGNYSTVELAQLQMENFTAYPQFESNVAVTDTQPFWIPAADSPSPGGNQGFHWNRNAKTHLLIGQSMATEMLTLIEGANPYTTWANANGITGDFDADDNGNGIVNGHEWYFASGNPQLIGMVSTGAGTSEFNLVRPKNRADVTETYQWSKDLVTWYDADGSDTDGTNTVNIGDKSTAAGPSTNYETSTMEMTVGGSVTPKLFIQLKLHKP
ncbi:MAG: sialate O-acetylesterase [Akkermansiaceae bacterium]